ncbi:MAG: ATP/GTP-binding protein [Candidatus Freyarchaeota archaeon]
MSGQILDEMNKTEAGFILIDLTGQLEVFAFKPIGGFFIEKLQREMRVCGISLTVSGFVVSVLMSIAIQIQLDISLITVLHKSDLLKSKELLGMLNEPELLKDKITTTEQSGVMTDMVQDTLKRRKILSESNHNLKKAAKDTTGSSTFSTKSSAATETTSNFPQSLSPKAPTSTLPQRFYLTIHL